MRLLLTEDLSTVAFVELQCLISWDGKNVFSQTVDDELERMIPPTDDLSWWDTLPLPFRDLLLRRGAAAGGGLLAAVRAMPPGCLAVQGPPGTGKTWSLAGVIAALVAADPEVRVLVSSNG